jgi:hypothetical protein
VLLGLDEARNAGRSADLEVNPSLLTTVVRGGPLVETKEQLGGYYLVECKDLDEAIEAAARIPSARLGSIEVRPIMELPEEP